jgi:hypothetical protein
LQEVKAIAKDIAFNSGKINHHGKRADTIVKGKASTFKGLAAVKKNQRISTH